MSEPDNMNIPIYRDSTVIGWVHEGGCDINYQCRIAIAEGRPWHAIPAGSGVTLSDYHFSTEEEATEAIRAAMVDTDGLQGRP